MPAKQIAARAKALKRTAPNAFKADAQSVLATLKRLGNPRFREEMETRYGIVTKDAFGVRMNEMQRVAKQLGRNHALALALWETGNYEARMVAAFVAEPERVTPALMDRWCRDFDNWAICDTVCFKLFDQLPHAFGRVEAWANRNDEFQKRAAFALLASLALHNEDERENLRLVGLSRRRLGHGETDADAAAVVHEGSAKDVFSLRWRVGKSRLDECSSCGCEKTDFGPGTSRGGAEHR